MKLISLELCGLPAFPDYVKVPLDELGDASVICFTGPNGSGKTTVIESPVAAWSRKFPSRGMLAEGCTEPKSYVQAVYDVGGKRVEIEVVVNGTAGKIKSRKFDVDPTVPFSERAIKSEAEFAKAGKKHLPSREVYLSSAFGTSNKAGSFLTLGFAERRRLLAQIIGIEKWQDRSDAAKERAKALTSDLAVLKGKIAALESSGGVSDDEIGVAIGAVSAAGIKLQDAQRSHAEQTKLVAEWTASVAEIDAKITAATTEKTHAEKAAKEIAERVTALRNERTTLDAKLADRDRLTEIAKQEAGDPEEIRKQIAALNAAHAKYTREWQVWNLTDKQQSANVADVTARLSVAKKQAAALDETECGGEGKFAACGLIKNAIEAKELIVSLTQQLEGLLSTEADPRPEKPDTSDLPGLEKALEVSTSVGKAVADAKVALAGMEAAAQRINDVADAISLEEAKQEKAGLALAGTLGALTGLGTQRKESGDEPTTADKTAVDAARTALQTKRDELARLEERKRLADEAAVTLKDTREQIAAKTIDLDDWATLRDACGPTGIQAYLIDAAAPELSAICNDVLHECYGSRFTVRLATQAAGATKGKTLEICDITVLDNERGTDCSASVKSTGEQALINEALSLAGVVFNNRRSEIPMRDIFRDECTTGLDMENGPLYIGMLRKAAKMCEARIFPVLHLPPLFDLCDGRLHVEGGEVVVK